jgi:hypothetical protein
LDNLTIYYSWFNILQLNNNQFGYSDGNTDFTVNLIDGSYEISDINNCLHQTMKENGHSKKEKDKTTYPINLYANTNFYRITATIKEPYKLKILNNAFSSVLGMNPGTYSKTFNGQSVPNLEQVESVFIHCNLVDNPYGTYSRLLYTFSPQNNKFGDLLSITPYFPRWVNTFNSTFNTIEVWLTDQGNKMLEIIDPKITVTLMLKAIKIIKNKSN